MNPLDILGWCLAAFFGIPLLLACLSAVAIPFVMVACVWEHMFRSTISVLRSRKVNL